MATSRYPALKIIAAVMKFSGYLTIVLGIIGGLSSRFRSESLVGAPFGLTLIITGFVLGLFLVAHGELISLLIDIERNTRLALDGDGESDASSIVLGCPSCHGQFRPGITRCEKCDRDLVVVEGNPDD